MDNATILTLQVYSKNIFFDHPYELTYDGDKILFYKLKQGVYIFRFQLLIRIMTQIKWITKIEGNLPKIIGFTINIKKKFKNFLCKDVNGLLKQLHHQMNVSLKNFLSCKCSFANFDELFNVKSEISRGSSGSVKKIQCKQTGNELAVKFISKKDLTPLNYSILEQEIAVMNKVKGYNYFVKIQDLYQDDLYYLIIMNYLEGYSLSHYLENNKRMNKTFSLFQIFSIMKRLFEALIKLSQLEIIHRDIKPQNLVLAEEDDFNSLTIIDFGFATFTNINRYLLYKCGTPGYAAPEVLNSQCTYYSFSCDIFSSGCMLYLLQLTDSFFRLFNELPFKGDTTEQLVHNNRICQLNLQQEKYFYAVIQNLLKSLLEKNTSDRITLKAAYEQFSSLYEIYKQRCDTEDCHDSSPLVNRLPNFDIQIGRIFESSSIKEREQVNKVVLS
ncbi:unnamed protein product (macronuclear) [Paramecium tetraurelia]|uniref:Protein kinase domain-containing protein n=1 Tax=Paramecium tetraurelia TaxID=5888 RepID=A0BVG9_PARTE|nr:uncharacterized protein GSPATT00005782001 [Paramecium tetraurelia]CAK62536.1 unnamed protein product [Paramecium tetraurelia]|eukprot:XP_001429934.1 hypothetical protein (macronuclear) [Paramecium tetraurelia strain d4-2]